MAYTYNSSNIGSSGLATVRFYVGDTSSSDILLQNAEITAILTNITSNKLLASAYAAEAIAGKFSRKADVTNEGLSVQASQRAEAYTRLARSLRTKAYSGAEIFVGGRSQDTKDDRAADTDLVQPAFQRGQDDYAGSVGSVGATTD